MSLNFKRTYKFAFKSALYITILSVLFLGILSYFIFSPVTEKLITFLTVLALLVYIISFLVIQYRVDFFIYKKIKRIYDDVSFLESSTVINEPITTDIATLTREVKKFASDKRMEIESLKVREVYRREFLGNISHELKTPLFTVQGYLLTLLDGAMKDKTLRKKYLQRAEKGVERLVYIVKDLDMISKLEMGDLNLNIEKFDLVETVKNVFDLLEMKAEKKNIILSFDNKYSAPIYALGDSEKIQQALTNLIVNAIKYGKENGFVEVGFDILTNGKIITRVKDNGEGIEKQNIPRLFERFYRIDKSGSRTEGGSGLGLSIVKHIIEAHNGKIHVQSQYSVGSEFSFTLEKTK